MKQSAVEVLATIFEQVELDKINQEIDAMSDEQIVAELEAEGYTQAKIDAAFAEQQKMLDALLADEKRRRRMQVVTYVGGFATAAAVALVVRHDTTTPPTVPPPVGAPSPAETLREEAFEACGRGHWQVCEHKLDEAKGLDEDGERDPDVQRARKLIAEHH